MVFSGIKRGLSFAGSGIVALVRLFTLRRIAAIAVLAAAVLGFYRLSSPDNIILGLVLLALALVLFARR